MVSDQPIGVVCVFGNEPREFTEKQKDALAALARQASANLELRGRNGELRELAITDPLTGLANRTLLFDRFNLALAQKKHSRLEVGVLFCDVDDFKSVNDRFGHEVGDLLLCDIADRLRDVFRDGDTLARIAGDEFVVICPELQGRDEVEEIAARLARSVATIGPLPDGSGAPNLTVGATIAEGGEGPAEALNRADAAMYAAKPTL